MLLQIRGEASDPAHASHGSLTILVMTCNWLSWVARVPDVHAYDREYTKTGTSPVTLGGHALIQWVLA